MNALRSVFAVLGGACVSILMITGIEAFTPTTAYAIILSGWAAATLAGSWLAATVARWSPFKHGILVTAILLATGIANMTVVPHPTWVWIAGILVFVLSGFAGAALASRPKAA